MIARTKVDHEVESTAREGKVPHVSDVQRCVDVAPCGAVARVFDERPIDVEPDELDRLESFGQHGKRNATSASDLEHSAAPRKTQCTQHERELEALLQAVARFDVVERTVVGRRYRGWYRI